MNDSFQGYSLADDTPTQFIQVENITRSSLSTHFIYIHICDERKVPRLLLVIRTRIWMNLPVSLPSQLEGDRNVFKNIEFRKNRKKMTLKYNPRDTILGDATWPCHAEGPEAVPDMGHLDMGEGQRKSVHIRAFNSQQQTNHKFQQPRCNGKIRRVRTPGELGFTHLTFFTMKGTSEPCIEVVSKHSRSH